MKINGKTTKIQQIAVKNNENCTKKQKKCFKMCKNAPREAKNGSAGLKSEPGWTKMGTPGPLLRTLDAFLATWGVPLCMFMHFYQVFVNTCAF